MANSFKGKAILDAIPSVFNSDDIIMGNIFFNI